MSACSYCGKENSDTAANCWECGTELPRPHKSEPAAITPPDLAKHKFIPPEALDAFFHFEAGFHRADWQAIDNWVNANISPIDTEAAYTDAALAWVTKLCEDLGGDYFILQSNQTILLCDQPRDRAHWLLDYTGQVATTIKNHLGQTAWAGAFGQKVVLLFSDEDDYYQYLSYHSQDGEQASSGGVCIHSGYTHIAIPWHGQLDTAANTIVHELTHDCLSHLPLPLWLNEGIAVTVQKAIAPPEHGLTQSDHSKLSTTMMNWRSDTSASGPRRTFKVFGQALHFSFRAIRMNSATVSPKCSLNCYLNAATRLLSKPSYKLRITMTLAKPPCWIFSTRIWVTSPPHSSARAIGVPYEKQWLDAGTPQAGIPTRIKSCNKCSKRQQ